MTDEVKGRLSGGTDRVPPKREVDRARARADWRWDVAAAGARPRRRCRVGAQLQELTELHDVGRLLYLVALRPEFNETGEKVKLS